MHRLQLPVLCGFYQVSPVTVPRPQVLDENQPVFCLSFQFKLISWTYTLGSICVFKKGPCLMDLCLAQHCQSPWLCQVCFLYFPIIVFKHQVYSSIADEYDAYIIVSFVNATLVLSIGETVEEVTDSGFLGTTPTLSCSQLGDDALVQVGLTVAFAAVEILYRCSLNDVVWLFCHILSAGVYTKFIASCKIYESK